MHDPNLILGKSSTMDKLGLLQIGYQPLPMDLTT